MRRPIAELVGLTVSTHTTIKKENHLISKLKKRSKCFESITSSLLVAGAGVLGAGDIGSGVFAPLESA